jgi:cbb3-type cytochrome oxidase subunit 1
MKLSYKYLLAAAAYGLCGMILGMVMGAKHDFTLAPVHAHNNLLGWVALTLYGLTYNAFPSMNNGKIGHIQFYIANIGLFLMLPSLAMLLKGSNSVETPLVLGEICTVLSLLLFIINLWKNRMA